MSLDRQINLFKIDTCSLMWDDELELKNKISELRHEKHECSDPDAKAVLNDNIKRTKSELLGLLSQRAHDNRVRQLHDSELTYTTRDGTTQVALKKVVSMFESTLSRSFGIATNELTYDIFIVEVFYYDVAQDLILNGFDYNGRHYVYFSSSAGQIRKKKCVFVAEDKYDQCRMKLTCGLTIDHINEKGGMNINKYIAYLALANSATDLWQDVFGTPFDIDRCIVVGDFETLVPCKVNYINYETYEIKPDVDMDIPIPHTDGCGMIDPSLSAKNFMVRLPFIKGLLGSFDFRRFLREHGHNGDVVDMWGKKYNIFDDDIQIIFTKSQLKMYKYYASWDEYKENFKRYGCEAGICNMEEDRISNAKINYQMLQTLYDATDEEIADICAGPNKRIKNVSKDLRTAMEFFGVYIDDDQELHKDWFQKSIKLYPELIGDQDCRADLRDLKNSYVKKYRGGRLDVLGKFTFVLPDLYAFCEWLFLGEQVPGGLLENGEVFCRLYPTSDKLDCLRSPHLYIEHAIRNNVYRKKYRGQYLNEWFNTDAIYTSTFDPISRILQLDDH